MSDVIAVCAPNENVNDETVLILRWLAEDGHAVAAGQSLVEVETSKAIFEIPAPSAGILETLAKPNADVPVGATLCFIGPSLEAIDAFRAAASHAVTSATPVAAPPAVAARAPQPAPDPQRDPQTAVTNGCATRFSLRASALIQSRGLDPKLFDNHGLVCEADVLARLGESHIAVVPDMAAAPQRTPTAALAAPVAAMGVPVASQKLSRAKRMEIKYLASGHAHTLPSAVTVLVQTQGLAALKVRDPNAAGLLSAGTIFETARLLRRYPQFNAFYADEQVHQYNEVNIGFAVDIDHGLKVPIIHHADTKTVPRILQEQRDLVIQYLDGQLLPQALSGGTFTITDLSSEGVRSFVPLINQGQSAILGITGETPAAGGGTYELILAFDHQLAEGRSAAKFLCALRDRLQAHEASLQQAARLSSPPEEPRCARCKLALSDMPKGHYLLNAFAKGKNQLQPICTICIEDY